jgi:hypothetical protein
MIDDTFERSSSCPRRNLVATIIGRIFTRTHRPRPIEMTAKKPARKRGTPATREMIAERVFQRADGKEVRAIVGRPRRSKRGWECKFQVLGVGHNKVYNLEGEDSLEALQTALAMMAIQIESYQRDHGLTYLGSSALLVMKPDFEALMREVEAAPEYPEIRRALEGHPWFTDGNPAMLKPTQ